MLWDDHHPEPYRKTEHLDQDLADRANQWITGHKSLDKDLPFMMLWASGSMHSPNQAPVKQVARTAADRSIQYLKSVADAGPFTTRQRVALIHDESFASVRTRPEFAGFLEEH